MLENSECTLLSNTYKGKDEPLLLLCNCGNTFETTWHNFKRNKLKCCKECVNSNLSSIKRLSLDYIRHYIEVDSNSGCRLLSTVYKNAQQKLKILCVCGNIFETNFNSFSSNRKPKQQCNECSNLIRWETSRIIDYVSNYPKIKLIQIVGNPSFLCELELECECGNIYNQKLNKFYLAKHKMCPSCVIVKRSRNNRNPYIEVKNNIESIDGYVLISNAYNGYRGKLDIQCPEGHIFQMSYKNFYYEGCRCLECGESEGVRIIKNWLRSNSILFIQEYIFEDCRNILPLPFDFAIFEEDTLTTIIEYDGQFHYLNICGKDKLIYQKLNDQVKNHYCDRNNIKLLRIPYWENENIEAILEEEFYGTKLHT